MHDIISRDIRKFIQQHGRYRFTKLYDLLQNNASLDHISELLELDHISIMHWKTIFEMIGSDGIPSFDSPQQHEPCVREFEIIVNENPLPSTSKNDKEKIKSLFTVYSLT